jgi:multimeric flavodoxin WrbA
LFAVKVLGIVCSPRKEGNTEILVREALEAAGELGSETELFLVAGKDIAPCDGCGVCLEKGVCRINDDMQTIYQQLELADGVILGTPVYFWNVSAQAKAVMDRTFALFRTGIVRGKIAASLVAARRIGAGQVINLLNSYYKMHGMMIAGWGIGYGMAKGDVRQGVGGSPTLSALEEAKLVGKSVVRMVERFSEGKT